jgi:hypothetical protein
MIRAPSVRVLIRQIASIHISNIDLQQFFARESRSDSFVVPNFTAETFVEPDALCRSLAHGVSLCPRRAVEV